MADTDCRGHRPNPINFDLDWCNWHLSPYQHTWQHTPPILPCSQSDPTMWALMCINARVRGTSAHVYALCLPRTQARRCCLMPCPFTRIIMTSHSKHHTRQTSCLQKFPSNSESFTPREPIIYQKAGTARRRQKGASKWLAVTQRRLLVSTMSSARSSCAKVERPGSGSSPRPGSTAQPCVPISTATCPAMSSTGPVK